MQLFSRLVMSHSFATPWTVTHQASLSMEFSSQVYWSRLPFPSPGGLPYPGIKPASPIWQAVSLPLSHLGKLLDLFIINLSLKYSLGCPPLFFFFNTRCFCLKYFVPFPWFSSLMIFKGNIPYNPSRVFLLLFAVFWFYVFCVPFLVAQTVKNLPAVRETWVESLGQEDPLAKGMTIHSRFLAWRIP